MYNNNRDQVRGGWAHARSAQRRKEAGDGNALMKELNQFEDEDDIEDVMLRDGVIHFVKPHSS